MKVNRRHLSRLDPGRLWGFPFYPLLIGFYPVLYLWSANYVETPAFVVVRPLWFSVGFSLAVWLVFGLIFRNLRKASLAAATALVLFFFYGHVYELVAGWTVAGVLIGRPLVLLGIWGLILGGVLFWLARTPSRLYSLTRILNLAMVFLLALVIAQIVFSFVAGQAAEPPPSVLTAENVKPAAAQFSASSSPDVYYILLDGYGREDLLRQDIGLDNHEFIAQLEQLGFVIPTCTQSNYNTTIFAVASTFQMDYLDDLGYSDVELLGAEGGDDRYTPALVAAIQSNPVMRQFQEMGYQVITFKHTYPFLNFPNADIIYDNDAGLLAKKETVEFENLFAQTTLLQRLIREVIYEPEKFQGLPGWMAEFINPNIKLDQKYLLDSYQLDQLDQIIQVPGKKFLYAHLLTTHPDFAFTLTGEQRAYAEETRSVYAEQIQYTNQRILETVKIILARSATPPIIILQGDHGYGYGGRGPEQFKILNAYYLPQGGKDQVYPEITPVNTFRLILSEYFGSDYPLRPDRSIWISDQLADGDELVGSTCMP